MKEIVNGKVSGKGIRDGRNVCVCVCLCVARAWSMELVGKCMLDYRFR